MLLDAARGKAPDQALDVADGLGALSEAHHHVVERRRVPVVLLHEALDPEERPFVREAQPLRHTDLLVAS
jgi:hypothetical protein